VEIALMGERVREFRRSKRKHLRNAAWIVLDGGERIPCVLWDKSETGARIAAARVNAVPNIFGLFLTRDGKSRRYCRAVWRKDGQLGIRFIDEVTANIDLEPASRRLRSKTAPVAPSPPKTARPGEVTMEQLVLPGAGFQARAFTTSERPVAFSAIAFVLLVLLVTATVVFTLAGIYGHAAWAMKVCGSVKQFCQHPEWMGAAGAMMGVVYLAAKGMER
jgi:hypothetical protein